MSEQTDELCEGCPPIGYETNRTRCIPCPRRSQAGAAEAVAWRWRGPHGGDWIYAGWKHHGKDLEQQPLYAAPQPTPAEAVTVKENDDANS